MKSAHGRTSEETVVVSLRMRKSLAIHYEAAAGKRFMSRNAYMVQQLEGRACASPPEPELAVLARVIAIHELSRAQALGVEQLSELREMVSTLARAVRSKFD